MASYFSDKTNNYLSKAAAKESSLENNTYTDKWQSTLDSQLDKILNQKDFSYDFNADPLYQQYKDQYTKLGKQAMMDTTGQVAALSGGYGNSYAATAGSQAYQNYLSNLNNVIPDLYNAALNKYQMDTEKLYNQYEAVGTQSDREYNRWSDKWDKDMSLASYYMNAGQSFASMDQSDYQFEKNYAQAEYQFAQNYALQLASLTSKNSGSTASSSGSSASASTGSSKSSSGSKSSAGTGASVEAKAKAKGYVMPGKVALANQDSPEYDTTVLTQMVNDGFITQKQAISAMRRLQQG